MGKLKRLASFLIAVLTFTTFCGVSASAEGFTFNWDSDENTSPHCKSILMLNLDTDTVVYSLNPDQELPMASMTKIMSYIVAYEAIPDIENTKITVPQSVADELEGTGSSLADVQVGEEFTGKQLLYLMMVPSGNDAALTLAKYVDGLYETGQIKPKAKEYDPSSSSSESSAVSSQASQTVSSELSSSPEEGEENLPDSQSGPDPTDYTGRSYFVQLMNEKAMELGCEHTHFTNPHGLHNPSHYTTAREMAVITKYAMTLPYFTEITGTSAYLQAATNLNSQERTVYTTNKMLTDYADENGISYYYQSATGIKTGSLDESGYCITASATAYGYTYIVVAMGCPMYDEDGMETDVHGEMLDARSLFRWAVTALEKKTVAAQGDILSSVKLEYAFQKDELRLAAGENASVMLPSTVDATSIVVTPNKPESVQAPVRKGEQIGTASLSYAGEVIATVPLVAAESVAKSDLVEGWEQGKDLVTSPWFMVIIAVIAALIIVYIILIFLYRRKQRQLRRVRRFRDM